MSLSEAKKSMIYHSFQLYPLPKQYPSQQSIKGTIAIGPNNYATPSNAGTFELPMPIPYESDIPDAYGWLIRITPEGKEASRVNTFADKL